MEEKINIIIADNDQEHLKKISDFIKSLGYNTLKATNFNEVMEKLESNDVHLIILDSMLPPTDGFQLCKAIKSRLYYSSTPIIILTSETEDGNGKEDLKSSADFIINKPFDNMNLELTVRNLLELKFLNNKLLEIQKLLVLLVEKLEDKNKYTREHSVRVRDLSVALGKKLGLMEWDLQTLSLAATFHNIGYIFIDSKLLEKKLGDDSAEKREILKHVLYSEELCKSFSPSSEFLKIIRHHHEHYDGSGYPEGLKEEDIPMGARIISVTEAFVSMTSDRPYREKMDVESAKKVLMLGSGKLWEPSFVKEFLEILNA